MTLAQVQKRLTKLEQTVQRLEQELDYRQSVEAIRVGLESADREKGKSSKRVFATGRWWVDHSGQFAGDPVFKEIVRLGQKYRESLRPKQVRRKRLLRGHS